MTQAEAGMRERAMSLLLAGGMLDEDAALLTDSPRLVCWGDAAPNSTLALMLGAWMAGHLPEVGDEG